MIFFVSLSNTNNKIYGTIEEKDLFNPNSVILEIASVLSLGARQ
jgi:hypothetical protein